MDAILESCAGLDVHQETVVACAFYGPLDRRPKKEIKVFGTTTKELLNLQSWLIDKNCTHVAMESTSVYWKPVWNILEGTFELILGNAQRIKNVPGRKTDIKDAEWIAKLLRCGLIEPSFVPPTDIRELRDLTRYRRKLLQNMTAEKNRIHKVLQDANIKLTTYMSDVFGVSGMALLEALVNGEVLDSEAVKALVKSQLKEKVPLLMDALNGRLTSHHRLMIDMHLNHIKYIKQHISVLEDEIEKKMASYQEAKEILMSLPMVKKDSAAVIIAEIGTDMSHFPSEAHLASWAQLCPGNNESAGKKKSAKTLKGNRGLKAVLCQLSWTASRMRGSRLSAFYWRLVKRRGENKTIIALSHLILKIIYNMLKHKKKYEELGSDYLAQKKKTVDRLKYQLEKLGYTVSVQANETV